MYTPEDLHKASLVWGKYSPAQTAFDSDEWLPLWVHLFDSSKTVAVLWDEWLPEKIIDLLCEDLILNRQEMRFIVQFLAGMHDVGKCTPDFSGRDSVSNRVGGLHKRMVDAGYGFDLNSREMIMNSSAKQYRHELLSDVFVAQHIVKKLSLNFEKLKNEIFDPEDDKLSFFSILAGHHGSPAEAKQRMSLESRINQEKFFITGAKLWETSLECILDNVYLLCSQENKTVKADKVLTKVINNGVPARSQVLLTSIVILSDWIASNPDNFEMLPLDKIPEVGKMEQLPEERYKNLSVEKFQLPARIKVIGELLNNENMEKLFLKRFGFSEPNDFQKRTIEAASNLKSPALVILEAGMGEGKTEAALAVAEIFEHKHLSNGFFFGLPTMATANAVFERVERYLLNRGEDVIFGTFGLSHSKSHLNDAYDLIKNSIKSKSFEGLVSSGWLNGKRQRVLNNFVVGTVDSFLSLSLKAKWSYFKHLGFASKTIIVDEVHSMDDYMFSYLERAIEWAAYYKCPVVVLSATLPSYRRQLLIEAYQRGSEIA